MTSTRHNLAGRMASHGVAARVVAPTRSSWPIAEPTTGATGTAAYPAFAHADKLRSQRPPEPSP